MENVIETLLLGLAPLVAAIWAATELIGRATGISKERTALVLGPLGSIVAHGVGWVSAGEGAWGYVAAGLLGLLATATAAVLHDKVVKPAMPEGE